MPLPATLASFTKSTASSSQTVATPSPSPSGVLDFTPTGTTAPPNNGGLSSKATVGISVGAVAGALVVFGFGFFIAKFFYARKRVDKTSTDKHSQDLEPASVELEIHSREMYEAPATKDPREMP